MSYRLSIAMVFVFVVCTELSAVELEVVKQGEPLYYESIVEYPYDLYDWRYRILNRLAPPDDVRFVRLRVAIRGTQWGDEQSIGIRDSDINVVDDQQRKSQSLGKVVEGLLKSLGGNHLAVYAGIENNHPMTVYDGIFPVQPDAKTLTLSFGDKLKVEFDVSGEVKTVKPDGPEIKTKFKITNVEVLAKPPRQEQHKGGLKLVRTMEAEGRFVRIDVTIYPAGAPNNGNSFAFSPTQFGCLLGAADSSDRPYVASCGVNKADWIDDRFSGVIRQLSERNDAGELQPIETNFCFLVPHGVNELSLTYLMSPIAKTTIGE